MIFVNKLVQGFVLAAFVNHRPVILLLNAMEIQSVVVMKTYGAILYSEGFPTLYLEIFYAGNCKK